MVPTRLLRIAFIALIGVGCSTDQIAMAPAQGAGGIEVRLDASNLAVGATVQAVATLKDIAGHSQVVSGDTVLWTSSNTSVATVDPSSGVITAINPGSTSISANIGSKVGTATVTVA